VPLTAATKKAQERMALGFRYFCVALAPAVDMTVALDHVPADGDVVKNLCDHVSPGGKGLNVARWLALRGAFVSCGGFLGADDAALFRRELGRYGIGDRFVLVEGPVRRNETILAPGYGFKLNRAAYPQLPERNILVPDDLSGTIVILSGALPAKFSDGYYFDLIKRMRAAGAAKVVLDASGPSFREGLKASPDLVKPNVDECEELLGFRPETPASFRKATEILRASAKDVLISDGPRGCWFNGEHVPAPEVRVLDATGAGDVLLAEYCFSGNRGFSVMAASAACSMPCGEPPLDWLLEAKAGGRVPGVRA
jgi:1-phosphofructokinase